MDIAKNKIINYRVWIHLLFIVSCLTFILPFILVISISFSNEADIYNHGYKLIPMRIDLTAYKYVFANPGQIIDSYITTTLQAVIGTLVSVIAMGACAYSLSRVNFRYRSAITFYLFLTMLFSGGLIPSYLLNTKYLHLDNTLWIYILPSIANAFQIIVFRTFFQSIPASLPESAKMDGASELKIFFRIIVPLSTPVIATIAFLCVVGRWNNWYTSLLYIRTPKLYTLQYLLQRILREAEFVQSMAQETPLGVFDLKTKAPTESMRYAMLVVAAGPMVLIFPFFQKYFSKGLTIGAVKG